MGANMPSIETKTDPTQVNEENLKLLSEFMTRRKTTINHLQPRGDLMPVVGAHEFAEIQPSNFIRFAERMNWDIPAEFKQTLNSIRTINKQQPKAEPETKNPINEKSNNMLKLIFVMAVDGYEYNPNDTRNAATGDKFGINQKIIRHINRRLDDATIKNCLDTAKALLGLFNKKTRKPHAKTILSLFIGMMMDRYENNHAKQSDMSKKLLEAITRVNDKLSLTIDIDSDAIEEILTEAKKSITRQTSVLTANVTEFG